LDQETEFKKMTTKFTTTVFALILAMQSLNAQVGRVWATIEDQTILPVLVQNQLTSSDSNFNQSIQSLSIFSVTKALPASRIASLRNVYEISCNCNENDLYATLVNQVAGLKKIEFAPNYESLALPNDYNTTFTNDYALDLINAEGAWAITNGNSNVVIGISDQNFETTHEELNGKINFYDNTNTANQTHGTAVAILAAGNTNNGVGKSSIGYNSSLSLYRMNYNDVLTASYAGVKVINLSWTSGCSFSQYAQDAINEVYNNGTFVIAAAGNGTTCGGPENLVYPAAYQNVFAVTSIGPQNNHERTIGNPTTTHQHNSSVDLSAPGYDVAISSMSGYYLFGNGTSYAAPQVAGTVGLMLAHNPCLTNVEIEAILKVSSDKIDDVNPSYVGRIGAGRLNAAAAVEMSKNISVSITNPTCFESANGSIELTINSENTASFQWTNGSQTEDLQDLVAGTYKVEIEFENGCKLWESVTLVQPEAITVNAQITNAVENDGVIDIQITGGTPAYHIIWNNYETQEHIENLSPGFYQVTVSDENGCAKTFEYEVQAENTTALIENTEANIQLYPNPSNGNSTITWNENAFKTVEIVKENGQLVVQDNVGFQNHYEINHLTPGMYFVKLITDNNQFQTRKLIVQ
jgi:hypothetical protein